jgi:hypothetical protein
VEVDVVGVYSGIVSVVELSMTWTLVDDGPVLNTIVSPLIVVVDPGSKVSPFGSTKPDEPDSVTGVMAMVSLPITMLETGACVTTGVPCCTGTVVPSTTITVGVATLVGTPISTPEIVVV